MSYNYILGFDNGTTAHFTLVDLSGKLLAFEKVPTYSQISWSKPTKKKYKTKTGYVIKPYQAQFTFIDIDALIDLLKKLVPDTTTTICYLERPAVNYHAGWAMQSSLSAFGAWLSVLYVLKKLGIKYEMIDSKQWQNGLIPKATGKNNKEYSKSIKRDKGERNKLLKKAADEFAKNLYGSLEFKDAGDGDSVCIAEYYRRIQFHNKGLGNEKN